MKIRITRSSSPLATNNRGSRWDSPPVKVREKFVYHCRDCNNKYYAYHFFCPQCLGQVSSLSETTTGLRITTCETDPASAIDLLLKLSEARQFPFDKALQMLPWICMLKSDFNIVQHWKECLEAHKIFCEILHAGGESHQVHGPRTKPRRKQAPVLFQSNAPYPCFMDSRTATLVRKTARAIPLVSTRLRWAEIVIGALHTLEILYKNKTGRILFYDIILKIEEQLRSFCEAYEVNRWDETVLVQRLNRLQDSFDRMAVEIREVREQVQEQL